MEMMTYKGYPLVRCGDDLYYGYMNEDHVVMLHAEKMKDVGGIRVAQKVRFYLMATDEKLSPIEAIIKNGERDTLYDALEVSAIWLDRANK